MVPTFDALRDEYTKLWTSAKINDRHNTEVHATAQAIAKNKDRYLEIQKTLGVSWVFVGAIHNMEASLDFETHLHCGDPLTKRTVNEPKGHPKADPIAGEGKPYTWL